MFTCIIAPAVILSEAKDLHGRPLHIIEILRFAQDDNSATADYTDIAISKIFIKSSLAESLILCLANANYVAT